MLAKFVGGLVFQCEAHGILVCYAVSSVYFL